LITQITDYAEEQGIYRIGGELAGYFHRRISIAIQRAMLGWIDAQPGRNATHIQHAHRLD